MRMRGGVGGLPRPARCTPVRDRIGCLISGAGFWRVRGHVVASMTINSAGDGRLCLQTVLRIGGCSLRCRSVSMHDGCDGMSTSSNRKPEIDENWFAALPEPPATKAERYDLNGPTHPAQPDIAADFALCGRAWVWSSALKSKARRLHICVGIAGGLFYQ